MRSARRSCQTGRRLYGRRLCWALAERCPAGQNPVCHPARSSRCCSQFRLQTSQELLSRLRRAAGYFPGMPCYEHFVALQKSVFVPLVFFLVSHLGTKTGLYYIDSTALPVCDNHRINRHKVFADLAQRGKTSMGWFFGFKLHLVFNNDNEIVALKLTPGNVHDTTPVPALTRELIGQIKGFSSLNLSKHRSVINAFVHIIAAITAYQINPFKPKLNLQPRYQLETTA